MKHQGLVYNNESFAFVSFRKFLTLQHFKRTRGRVASEEHLKNSFFDFVTPSDVDPVEERTRLELLCQPCWPSLCKVLISLYTPATNEEAPMCVMGYPSLVERKAPPNDRWQDLPMQQFPRLASNESIDFTYRLR